MAKANPITEYLAKIGKTGGEARAEALTPKQRSESAKKAARARWAEKNGTSTALADPGTSAENVQPIKKKVRK